MSVNPERIQKLIKRLKHVDPAVRLHAGVALGDLGAQAVEAVPALSALLDSDNVSDRKLAALALGYIGAPARSALPALRRALQVGDDSLRRIAAAAREKIEVAHKEARAA